MATDSGPLPQLDVEQAADRLTQPDSDGRRAILVDVRERNELEVVRAAGVVHVPLSTFADSSHALPKDRPLLFICATGKRSQVAAEFARRNGHPEVANVAGGTVEWRKRGLPTTSGPLTDEEAAPPPV